MTPIIPRVQVYSVMQVLSIYRAGVCSFHANSIGGGRVLQMKASSFQNIP